MKTTHQTLLASTCAKLAFAALALLGATATAHADSPRPCETGLIGTPLPILNLNDIQEIQTLKSKYTFAVDATVADPRKVDDLMALLSDDVCMDYGPFGRVRGKSAARTFFNTTIPSMIAWSLHFALDSVITAGLLNASAMWHFEARAVFKDKYSEGPITFFGHYEDQFVKTSTGWKIRSLICLFETPPTGP